MTLRNLYMLIKFTSKFNLLNIQILINKTLQTINFTIYNNAALFGGKNTNKSNWMKSSHIK